MNQLLYRLIVPNKALRLRPDVPILMAYFSLRMRQKLVPALAEQIYRPNPLLQHLPER